MRGLYRLPRYQVETTEGPDPDLRSVYEVEPSRGVNDSGVVRKSFSTTVVDSIKIYFLSLNVSRIPRLVLT